jgi:hypothetical protein
MVGTRQRHAPQSFDLAPKGLNRNDESRQTGFMVSQHKPTEVRIDAKTFQEQLGRLSQTIALKVQREGPKILTKPGFVSADIFVMLKQAHHTCNLFFFLNADERRKGKGDGAWKVGYSIVALPLIRCMIDCLYNITVILENPGVKGYQFRESGFKRMSQALDADEKRYGGDQTWDTYIAESRKRIDWMMRTSGITQSDVDGSRRWPTLGTYLKPSANVPLTRNQEFLTRLTYGFWQEYSGMAHATFQGLIPTAIFYTPEDIPHEQRADFDNIVVELAISQHTFRAAALLLCILTEIQARFRFDGARINQRLHEVWNALIPVPEIKELYVERYSKLMTEKGINPN